MSLGTGAKKGWWGPCASMRHSREVSMATLWAGTNPACGHQPVLSRLKKLQWKYLQVYLSETDFRKGREAQGSKFASETI